MKFKYGVCALQFNRNWSDYIRRIYYILYTVRPSSQKARLTIVSTSEIPKTFIYLSDANFLLNCESSW